MDKKELEKLKKKAEKYEKLIKKRNEYKKEKYVQKMVLIKKSDLNNLIEKLKKEINAKDEDIKEYALYFLIQKRATEKLKELSIALKGKK